MISVFATVLDMKPKEYRRIMDEADGAARTEQQRDAVSGPDARAHHLAVRLGPHSPPQPVPAGATICQPEVAATATLWAAKHGLRERSPRRWTMPVRRPRSRDEPQGDIGRLIYAVRPTPGLLVAHVANPDLFFLDTRDGQLTVADVDREVATTRKFPCGGRHRDDRDEACLGEVSRRPTAARRCLGHTSTVESRALERGQDRTTAPDPRPRRSRAWSRNGVTRLGVGRVTC